MFRIFPWGLFAVFAVGLWGAYGSVLSYYCITDGTIWVMNPNTTIFMSASAANNETTCNVSLSADYINITIAECRKELDILLTLSSRNSSGATGDDIVGGSAYSEIYKICCGEVPDEGVRFTRGLYVDVEAATVVGGTVTQPAPNTELPVTPTFTIVTSIWNYADTQERTSGYVSEQLRWKISGPAEYDVLPMTCTAYSGLAVGGSPSQLITTDGCSDDSSLVGNFQLDGSEQDKVFAWFYVFKFYNSDHLTLACTVKTCTRGAAACNLDCSKRKKRRSGSYQVFAEEDEKDVKIREAYVVAHLDVSVFNGASIMGSFNGAILLSFWTTVSLIKSVL